MPSTHQAGYEAMKVGIRWGGMRVLAPEPARGWFWGGPGGSGWLIYGGGERKSVLHGSLSALMRCQRGRSGTRISELFLCWGC